jgi:hypothetical protein
LGRAREPTRGRTAAAVRWPIFHRARLTQA